MQTTSSPTSATPSSDYRAVPFFGWSILAVLFIAGSFASREISAEDTKDIFFDYGFAVTTIVYYAILVGLTFALAIPYPRTPRALGLNPFRDRLCLAQLSAGDGVCHAVQFAPGAYAAPNLKRLLTDPKVLKLFHFARFDVAMFQRYLGVTCAPVYCTKIASKLVRTYTDRHGLKDLTRELLGVDISKEQQSSDWGAPVLTEKQLAYAAGDVAFVGGSLVPVGGHNLLEPAALGKPVLSGPSLDNVRESAQALKEAGVLTLVQDANSLADAAAWLLANPNMCDRIGQVALDAVTANRGALENALKLIEANLKA